MGEWPGQMSGAADTLDDLQVAFVWLCPNQLHTLIGFAHSPLTAPTPTLTPDTQFSLFNKTDTTSHKCQIIQKYPLLSPSLSISLSLSLFPSSAF